MKIQKMLIIITLLISHTAYTATGFLKLIVNKNPDKYYVNIQGTKGNRYIRFIGGQDARNSDAEYIGETRRDKQTGQLSGVDFLDYEVPKGKDNGRLFVFVYDIVSKQRVGAISILDLGDSVIQIEWSQGKINTSTTISSKYHNVAFRVIAEEDGTLRLAE
jgi:hypothetical protein